MIDIRTILCAVDFSDFSRHALEHAVQLARWFKSNLTVLYVYPPPVAPPPVLFGGLPGPLPPFPPLTTSPEQTAQRDDRRPDDVRRERRACREVTVLLQTHPGSPVKGILDESATLQSDLIVLGTHGHSGFDRWVLGSVTEKILRKAACPVLTVPPPVTESPRDAMGLFKRILCPLDFSAASLKACEYALSLAKEADAELLLMHVIAGLADLAHWQQPSSPAIVEYLRLSEQYALTQLRKVVPQEARDVVPPRGAPRHG